jgi:signal transduction histidine kinase
MLDSRRASTGHVEVVPRSLLAVRRSTAGFRRLLLVAAIAFIAMPIALLVMFAGTPLELLPFAISIAGAVWFSIEIRHLERDLRRARVRALDAVDAERQRISRDLHDSAQQRLVSTRIHLGLLAQAAEAPEDCEAIERIGRELDAALAEIRDVTRDSSPQLLLRDGVVESLRAVADHTPREVTIESVGFGRYEPKLERAVYFSCLEALQNAVKHGGPSAAVWVRLVGEPHQVAFSVDDSGAGFDPGRVSAGAGLMNVADRVDVLGGHLTIDSLPGMGTRIRAVIPLDPSQVLPTFSSTPARSGVRARLGAGVDVGARAEVYRSRGEPDQG